MPSNHPSAWTPPEESGQSADDILLESLAPDFGDVLLRGGFKYKSTDMQVGVDVDSLVLFSGTLKRLMQVDVRGGYFLQSDMELAIRRCATNPSHASTWDGWCKVNEYSHDEGYKNSAYAVRVMLSHVRNKADAWKKLGAQGQQRSRDASHPPELRAIYDIIDSEKEPAAARRTRPHPLPAFRAAQDASSDEEIIPVLKRFDIHTGESYLVLSDGSRVSAKFKQGEQGRLVATWPDHNMELQLELPNSALKDDGTIDYKPADPRKPPKKGKPAAAKKRPAAAIDASIDPEVGPNDLPVAPAAKSKAKVKAKSAPKPTDIKEKIKHNIGRIPEEARDGLQGFDSNELATCYCVDVPGGTISLRDLHRSPCFYVGSVTEIPEHFPGLEDDAVVAVFEGKTVNRKGGVQSAFGDDPNLAFKAAKLLRSMQPNVDA